METKLNRRQLFRNFIVASSAMAVTPSWAKGFLSSPKTLQIYTNIPFNLPTLGEIYKDFLLKSGSVSLNFPLETPHPSDYLKLSFLKSNTEISFLSTIGSQLSSADPRLSLIENTPVVGKDGKGIMNWLNEGGERYWKACASDWGYHVIPALLVNSTNLGWISPGSREFHYSNLSHKSRGVLESFLNSKGAQKSFGRNKDIFNISSGRSITTFIQMLNNSIDISWSSSVLNFNRVDDETLGNNGALLFGLFIPQTRWKKLSREDKALLTNSCRGSLKTSFERTSHINNNVTPKKKKISLFVEEYSDYVHSLINEESKGRENRTLKNLFI